MVVCFNLVVVTESGDRMVMFMIFFLIFCIVTVFLFLILLLKIFLSFFSCMVVRLDGLEVSLGGIMLLLEVFDCADLLEMVGIGYLVGNGGFSFGNFLVVLFLKRVFFCGSRRCWMMLTVCIFVVLGLVWCIIRVTFFRCGRVRVVG